MEELRDVYVAYLVEVFGFSRKDALERFNGLIKEIVDGKTSV